MKVRALFEFDLEDEDAETISSVERYRDAAADTEHAIRSRLMGDGFLDGDLLVGSWTLNVQVIDDAGPDRLTPGQAIASHLSSTLKARPTRRAFAFLETSNG